MYFSVNVNSGTPKNRKIAINREFLIKVYKRCSIYFDKNFIHVEKNNKPLYENIHRGKCSLWDL